MSAEGARLKAKPNLSGKRTERVISPEHFPELLSSAILFLFKFFRRVFNHDRFFNKTGLNK